MLTGFLDLPSALLPGPPAAAETAALDADPLVLLGAERRTFALDPDRAPSATLYLDFGGDNGNSRKVDLSLLQCAATCVEVATGTLSARDGAGTGLQPYDVVLTRTQAVVPQADSTLRLDLTRRGGQRAVLVGAGGATPSRVDVPALALP